MADTDIRNIYENIKEELRLCPTRISDPKALPSSERDFRLVDAGCAYAYRKCLEFMEGKYPELKEAEA